MTRWTWIDRAWTVLWATVLLRRGHGRGTHEFRAAPYFVQSVGAGALAIGMGSLGVLESWPVATGLGLALVGALGFGIGVTWFYFHCGAVKPEVHRFQLTRHDRLYPVGNVGPFAVESGKLLLFEVPAVFIGLYVCLTVCSGGLVMAADALWPGCFVVQSTLDGSDAKAAAGRWAVPDLHHLQVYLVQVASMVGIDNLKLALTARSSGASMLLALMALLRNAVLIVMAPVVVQSLAQINTLPPQGSR